MRLLRRVAAVDEVVAAADERCLVGGAEAAEFVADGTVGAIAVWVRDDTVRDPERFLELFEKLVPAWWPSNAS